MTRFSRTDTSMMAKWWWTIDRPLLASFLLLIIIGIAMVTTASPAVATHIGLGPYHFLIRHVIILIPSLALLFGFSLLPPQMIWRVSTGIFIGSLVALVFVLLFGMEIKGAQRWIHLPGFSLQPSEFVKPSFVIVGAWLLALQKYKQFPGNAMLAGLYALVVCLLILQPDLGQTVLVTVGWGTLIFIAGLRFRLLFILGGVGIAGLVTAYFTLDHVHSRINRFLNPESGDTFQVDKSLEAFQSGGVMGVGPGQGSVKMRLPDAHADFIFSVAGEELGLIFLLALIGLYAFIILRGLNKLMLSGQVFNVLAGGGLLALFGCQAFIHMGSALNLLPAKGMTLPFVSYGGSSLLSMSYAMGCVLALTKRSRNLAVSKKGLSYQTIAKRRRSGVSNSDGQ
jgi:cell division protein FtsW